MAVTEEVDQCLFPVVEGDGDDAAADKVCVIENSS